MSDIYAVRGPDPPIHCVNTPLQQIKYNKYLIKLIEGQSTSYNMSSNEFVHPLMQSCNLDVYMLMFALIGVSTGFFNYLGIVIILYTHFTCELRYRRLIPRKHKSSTAGHCTQIPSMGV